ncbi:LOW QUALITY PROTEIN: protein TASOR-like [Spinachia spinachia]
MALNPNAAGRRDTQCTQPGDVQPEEGGELPKNSAAANQNGDQPGCGDAVMPEQEAPDRRRGAQADARSSGGSAVTAGHRAGEEPPRRSFQIPRKIKGLYQFLPPDSREFEELVKVVSSFYLDASSRGTFSYCKARLIHNELLEKEFIEKRREMKQEGRTEAELTESYCFLYPDKSKLQWICEKGLSVGHSRITTLGNPSAGVYVSKYSDLLQINPFEVGSSGDMIVFKVMRGRIKHIHENMPKNAMEPTPKFDCHLSKSANRVTSLLSYRAFELTQQYFSEFAFDEIKARPRHVCPYAVVSFKYKGKEAAATPMTSHRFNTISSDGGRGRSCYTVWSGPLVNKGHELFPICLRSSSRPYLPFKLPEKLEMSRGMQLDQAKRKIPSVLFSWDTYSASREVMKCGMSCSLFEVLEGKGKPTSGSLAALAHKLERDRMVLVKSLFDRGFLFLLSSAQMVESKERRGRVEKNLQALFIFQEARMVVKCPSRLFEPEPQPAVLALGDPFVPALHYALFKLRLNPGKDPSVGVERQAADYLTRMDAGTVRPFVLPDYKNNVDERTNPLLVHRPKCNMDAVLRSYVHNPVNYVLPLSKTKEVVDRIRNPTPAPPPAPPPPSVEYSPVSDWGGSDRGSDRAERPPKERPEKQGTAHSNGAQAQPKAPAVEPQTPPPHRLRLSQNEYDKDKMKQLLKLIQLHKKAIVKEPGKERGEDGAWDVSSLKRKFQGDDRGGANKHQRTDQLSNGEPSRGHQAEEIGDEGVPSDNLTAVMESMGIYDTDLRAHAGGPAVNETQRLLKILLATLNKAVAQGSVSAPPPDGGKPAVPEPEPKKPAEPACQTNYTEEDMDCSPASPLSPGSPAEPPHTSDTPAWVYPAIEDQAQLLAEPKPEAVTAAAADSYADRQAAADSHADWQAAADSHADRKAAADSHADRKAAADSHADRKTAADSHADRKTAADSHADRKTAVAAGTKKTAAPLVAEEVSLRPSISLDTILNQEIHSLASEIKSIMHTHRVCYSSRPSPRLPLRHCWLPNSCFSDFVVPYVTPVAVQGHVTALCEKMDELIPAPPAPSKVDSPPPPVTTSSLATPPPTPAPASKPRATSRSGRIGTAKGSAVARLKAEGSSAELEGDVYSPAQVTPESPDAKCQKSSSGLLAGSLIGQLKPEVFSSLVEIFKDVTKNTVKFYIYCGDEAEESTVCKEIKEYLKSLGNSECSPQTFLENSGSLDKLLIIIQNEDIAANVHKIPALVSLKKLPSVSFAGVDSLDDVKNHTYNELFVSGGFMVSDEFVLNPDLITQDRLQGLLKFLEEQSTPEHPWQWKVHCKSQKKLKELGRLNANAMGLLNLLTCYQKKHLVEFLPYHECDTQSRQAPDLECLIKLQAQHTQQRHLIFLTERPFEMFLQYSRNGIVIGSIDDVMSGFHSLIGSINQNELPTPPSTVNDECVEEDMSLDSEDGDDDGADNDDADADEGNTGDEPTATSDPPERSQAGGKGKPPPPPETEEFRPPLPEQQATPERAPTMSDYSALKTAISQFKATNQMGAGSSDIGGLSPGGFPVNPHQSFLCPSASWYISASSYAASPAYPASPCSSTHEHEYRPPGPAPAAPAAIPTPNSSTAVMANLGSLPLEVKPPPPPHLMMLGHAYGSDAGGAGPVGNSPPPPPLPYADHSDSAQPAYIAGIPQNTSGPPPALHDGTLTRPGDTLWGGSTCRTAGQVGAPPGPAAPSGLPLTGEPGGGGAPGPGGRGGRTPANCINNLGAPVAMPAGATRGGSIVRPKMPPRPMCGMGYGGIGGPPGQMDHGPMRGGGMGFGPLGGFRGRGPPPVGLWPRPRRGHDRGGGPCSWGYPGGRGGARGPYSDYTYTHNYAPE